MSKQEFDQQQEISIVKEEQKKNELIARIPKYFDTHMPDYIDCKCASCGITIGPSPFFAIKSADKPSGKYEIANVFHGISCYRTFLINRGQLHSAATVYNLSKRLNIGHRPTKMIIPELPDPITTLNSYGIGSMSDTEYLDLVRKADAEIFIE